MAIAQVITSGDGIGVRSYGFPSHQLPVTQPQHNAVSERAVMTHALLQLKAH